MKRILQRYEAGEAAGHAMMPETLAGFIDLPGNDFNNLIQQLPPKVEDGLDHSGEDGEGRDSFAATIGGTFYDRLLPNESLHFAISMHSLHWISQVTDPSSPLYNKGRCWILGGDLAITQQFAQQSQRDWHKFLNSRAAEMVPGGIVLAYLLSREDPVHPENQTNLERRHRYMAGPDFENTWNDLIAQGVITAETRDAFNLPIYCPSKEEVESAVAKCGAFDMQCVEWSDDSDLFPEHERLRLLQYPHKFATFYSAWVRAMVGPIMEAHMGLQATNEWFVLHERRMVARATSLFSNPKGQQEYKFLSATFLLVVLKRK
ncbi:unnamed protein product [Sphagnum troendelagicum]|uniref:Methyltransferase type 11 domain-containing protein n=1 Tax=Sphagnum troendelagicum TaxID=128251 RepID=A0ABP0UIN3_9BRYO